jgi:NTP pyrophosphatase (non-canonical NTP hydrolase)
MSSGDTTVGSISALQQQLRDFARARDWEQFHSPKNLAMALTVEAGELQELFQWLTEAQSAQPDAQLLARAAEEIADVFLYLCRLSDVLGIDLLPAAQAKLALNAERYPVDKARGLARKYSDL